MRLWLLAIALINALAMATGLAVVRTPAALAPPIETSYPELPSSSTAKSLEELYELRDRLQSEFKRFSESTDADSPQATVEKNALLQTLQALEIRIHIEEQAQETWRQAIRMATEAVEMGRQPNQSLDTLQKTQDLWQQTISSLEGIADQTFLAEVATQKIAEYKGYLESVSYRYDTARSAFLIPIAERTGMSSGVHITVCHVAGECRRLRGNEPPASPASLIKVPIAIALMEKVTRENINLDTKVLVSRGNYTEDASDIWVGSEYPLRKILMRMINQSSNIATNQLIDYVGRDNINQILRDRGYETTFIGTKLVGDSIYPANAGVGPNEITTDELTDMMVQIYNFAHPGDDVILDALVSQEDWKLGYEALKKPAFWIGEKTGQNSKALGTTVGAKINGERYIITVVLNYSGSEKAVRGVISDVASHIVQQGHL